jgi:hypothetical protein
LDGVAGVSGVGSIDSVVIRDRVGNLMQSNREGGITELTIFVGGGFNFGNAPASYGTLLADNGARHRVDETFSLGPTVKPSADAVIPGGSSNDGVLQVGTASTGFPAQFTIDVRADGRPFYVDAWIDWNRNGTFEGSEVTRFKATNASGSFAVLGVGVNTISLNVPPGTPSGTTWGRFRLSETSGLGATGQAESGEVEDIAILVQSNPYQNPLDPYDVNKTGIVTPLDSLNILNLLSAYTASGGVPPIPLNPPPASLPDLTSGRFLPDVNGNGFVEPLDALLVLNEIARRRGEAEGESGTQPGLAEAFFPVAEGLLASPLTFVTQQDGQDRQGSKFAATEETASNLAPSIRTKSAVGSVFDSPEVIGLDEILDEIAIGRPEAASSESVDAVFSGLGLGL